MSRDNEPHQPTVRESIPEPETLESNIFHIYYHDQIFIPGRSILVYCEWFEVSDCLNNDIRQEAGNLETDDETYRIQEASLQHYEEDSAELSHITITLSLYR